jgi:hypothetical protein
MTAIATHVPMLCEDPGAEEKPRTPQPVMPQVPKSPRIIHDCSAPLSGPIYATTTQTPEKECLPGIEKHEFEDMKGFVGLQINGDWFSDRRLIQVCTWCGLPKPSQPSCVEV